ncbi:hypothetical protein SAMN04488515_2441 [Cognatiyoonia koreensis]|uniref:Polyketide cyclase / dehydrase and lipid transport n=1 Tax=Cognatiyoonia koreensis TaxID=364200 RepID=A0A1I0RBR3_9RHOB|nr:SRPBCC family protein [Cognatiyoonia koreensis]SEW38214.1 hypothetical protein SAMN04488515_2441 [Cognatiyoonia koreensis]
MKFSTREDIEAPVDYVFGQVSDFGAFERQALRRGAEVRRVDSGPFKEGSSWDVAFKFRGKDRNMRANLEHLDAPNGFRIETVANGIDGLTQVDLVPLSPHRTRIAVSIDLTAKSLSARLLLQSLKLAKSNLTNRFKKRIADFSQDIEDRYRTGA